MLNVDELWSFVFRSKDKVWVWISMNRETREIIASARGDRSENTCQILLGRVPSAYKEAIVFSDYWSAYQAVIPSEQHRPVGKETGETAHIEREICLKFFIHRIGKLVRLDNFNLAQIRRIR